VEEYHLLIFICNTLMVLGVTSLGYHLAPRLLGGMDEPEAVKAGVRTTRGLLPLVVMLYMFFNCLGYFEGRTSYLLGVSGLILLDGALQLLIRHKRRGINNSDSRDDE